MENLKANAKQMQELRDEATQVVLRAQELRAKSAMLRDKCEELAKRFSAHSETYNNFQANRKAA